MARGRVGSVIFVSVEHKLPCNLPVQYNVVKSSQVYVRFGTSLYINNRLEQTTIRKPIECAPEASSLVEGSGRRYLEATRRKVLTYVPSEKK